MATANEEYFDAALKRQIYLRRFSEGEMRRVLNLFEKADQELAEKLRSRLARFAGKPVDWTSLRYKRFLQEIADARKELMKRFTSTSRDTLVGLSSTEQESEAAILAAVIPLQITLTLPSAAQLRAIVTSRPFHGKLLRDWFKTLEVMDRQRLIQALQLGLAQGESTDDIVRRVIGNRKNNYQDGILSISRREATTIIRTAITHVSNRARESMWEANSDIIAARVWNSVLDGRTSDICIARDGHGAPVGDRELPEGIKPLVPVDARPPAHLNCRSVMIAVLDGVAIAGMRPYVSDTRTRSRREIDFAREARQRGVSINTVRSEWADRVIGRVPADVTYPQWLKKQPVDFQEDVLGKTKAKLFRDGGLEVDAFVDHQGRTLTLDQLSKLNPNAFIRAGLDPGNFG